MEGRIRVTALVGSYRKGGVIDRAVDEILSAAEEAGAETTRIYLRDRHIEFCRNCRTCTQEEGARRGACPVGDDMTAILDRIERSHALVLASPVNFGTVTAVMKRFIERLVCFVYWPWGTKIPKVRTRTLNRRAVLVVSSAAPAVLVRLRTGITGLLKEAAAILGARTVGTLYMGMVAGGPEQGISGRIARKARCLGKRLASPKGR
jgi:multimeric flavodoxin WrbA